jgi:predicted transcriptional regulator
MEILVVLYFIDLTFGSVGQGRVSRNDLATWFRVSKPTVAKFMQDMIDNGLVKEHEVSAKKGHGFIIKYSMTIEGKKHLEAHYEAAYHLYTIQVARVIEAIKAKNKETREYAKLSAKEKRQIEAGQRELL